MGPHTKAVHKSEAETLLKKYTDVPDNEGTLKQLIKSIVCTSADKDMGKCIITLGVDGNGKV